METDSATASRRISALALAALTASLLLTASPARSCHGPGTSAGGVQVWSARPMARGSYSGVLRFDLTQFESLSSSEIEAMTLDVSGSHAHLDVVDRSLLSSIGLFYGLTDNLEFEVVLGYYAATGVGEGQAHDGASYQFFAYGDVDGLADSWMGAKLRVRSAPSGDIAVIAALKAHTGDDDVVRDGVAIDQSLQPGSGAWDASLAIAFTRELGARFIMDASAQYVFRGEANNYRIGDQANAGVAFAGTINDFHASRRWWAFLELAARVQSENEASDGVHVNSGGTTLFLTPGLRGDIFDHWSFDVGFQLPLVQDLNDVQQQVDYKFTGSVTASMR